MNREILLTVLALAFVLLATPFVSAVPGAPKNNSKFQTWHYEKAVNFGLDIIVGGEHVYIPSFEEVNRLVISSDAGFLSYEITVGSNTYYQGVDFDCGSIGPAQNDRVQRSHRLTHRQLDRDCGC